MARLWSYDLFAPTMRIRNMDCPSQRAPGKNVTGFVRCSDHPALRRNIMRIVRTLDDRQQRGGLQRGRISLAFGGTSRMCEAISAFIAEVRFASGSIARGIIQDCSHQLDQIGLNTVPLAPIAASSLAAPPTGM